MTDLAEQTAVVTGGTGALGRVVTVALARAGARCQVTYVDASERGELEAGAGKLGTRLTFHEVDATEAAAVEGFYDSLDGAGLIPAILVNIAGGFRMGPVESTSVETWDYLMNLNARSVFLHCREAVRRMKPRRAGRIVTISAKAALEAPPKMAAYVAAKAAVLAFTRSLARELADDRITANAILPSVIDTPANRRAMPKADFDTWVTPEQIADAVLFLVGPQSAGVSGTAVRVYGRV